MTENMNIASAAEESGSGSFSDIGMEDGGCASAGGAEKLSFETALQKLEEVVRHLERGDKPLDESLALFEQGAALVKRCNFLLDTAEQKVTILRTGMNGEPAEEAFNVE